MTPAKLTKRRGGGFTIQRPDTYVASKHDSKLEEVATTVVGRDGWYVKVDQRTRTRTCEFVPSSPPTFPGMLPTPMGQVKRFDAREKSSFLIPMGMKLPAPGEKMGEAPTRPPYRATTWPAPKAGPSGWCSGVPPAAS